MRKFIVLLLLPVVVAGQKVDLLRDCNKYAIYFTDTALSNVISENISKLPDGNFYMISQIHNSKFDIPLEQALLFALFERGVQYDIVEYPHSAFFLVNEYLETGDTTLLKLINQRAPFQFIKHVFDFNSKIERSRQIRFYGIDYELYNIDRGKHYREALLYIYSKNSNPIAHSPFGMLFEELKNVSDTDIVKLTEIQKSFQKLLSEEGSTLGTLFGKYSMDIFLILSAPTKYQSIPKRDKWLFSHFKMVYDFVSKQYPGAKFIASFGAAHVKTGNNNNLWYKLQNLDDSPVKDAVIKIGVQYFNGGGGIKEAKDYFSAGILDFKVKRHELQLLSRLFDERVENAILLDKLNLPCFNNLDQRLSWLFLVDRQPWVKYWKWE